MSDDVIGVIIVFAIVLPLVGLFYSLAIRKKWTYMELYFWMSMFRVTFLWLLLIALLLAAVIFQPIWRLDLWEDNIIFVVGLIVFLSVFLLLFAPKILKEARSEIMIHAMLKKTTDRCYAGLEHDRISKCPFCGAEMVAGFIGVGGNLYYSNKGRLFDQRAIQGKILYDGQTAEMVDGSILFDSGVRARLCKTCNQIHVSYQCAVEPYG